MSAILVETDEQKRKCLSDLLALVILFSIPTTTRTARAEQERIDLLLPSLAEALNERMPIMGVFERVDALMNGR